LYLLQFNFISLNLQKKQPAGWSLAHNPNNSLLKGLKWPFKAKLHSAGAKFLEYFIFNVNHLGSAKKTASRVEPGSQFQILSVKKPKMAIARAEALPPT
jgi:hypothetical protein